MRIKHTASTCDRCGMVNAISLNFVILIPTDSAAIRLSRIAITARPVLEFTKLYTINKMTRIMITLAVKLDK